MSKALRFLQYVMLLGTFVVSLSSCEDDEATTVAVGTISGAVTGERGEALSDVTVTVSGVKEEDIEVKTDANGKYTVENVSIKLHAVTFAKKEYLRTSLSVNVDSFDESKHATVDVTMLDANKKITGVVKDVKNGLAPLAGVTVSVGVAGEAVTDANGAFVIENLVAADYTVNFHKETYVDIKATVSKTGFDAVTGIADLGDIAMGGKELLRGLTIEDLRKAEKWYFNEYRGGRNADSYPHWDWSTDYMGTLDFRGDWEEQNEGTTLRIRNGDADRANPANTDVFDSFVFGSKTITADNKIMSLRVRTHSASDAAPAVWGVQVVDLTSADPAPVKIGDIKTLNSEAYQDFDFDLSQFVGKEVVIAVGTYRNATGDYWKQLVLRAIRFSTRKVISTEWLPGTEVVNGWKLTTETVAATMPQTKKLFSGLTTYTGEKSRDRYIEAYRTWRDNNHVGANWSLLPVKKDPEPFAGQGYIIKTRNDSETSTTVPEAHMYAKFSIAAGSNQLVLHARNFSSNPTYFKVSAVQNNGTVTHLSPTTNTANSASADADGLWKFSHEAGEGGGNLSAYAEFDYDLSQFNGEDVTIVIGVYNVAGNSGENKLSIRQIELK